MAGADSVGRYHLTTAGYYRIASYSPNLNLIERLWKFTKRRAVYGRYHPTFTEFRAAIEEVLDGLSTTHADQLKTLMTLKFQLFEDVSLMAA